MKRFYFAVFGVSVFAVSCSSDKKFTVLTSPPGAEIAINGKPVGVSPVTVEIKQDKDLGIVAVKPGYEAASATVPTTSNWWRSLLWTRNDPKAKVIEQDEVQLTMKKIPAAERFSPTVLPAFDVSRVKRPAAPSLPDLPPLPAL